MNAQNRAVRKVPGLLVLLALSGCVPDEEPVPQEMSITMEEAREFQNRALKQFADFVPSEAILADDGPVPKMSALNCERGGSVGSSYSETGAMLPGGQEIEVRIGTNLDAVLLDIHETYALEKGWESTWYEDESGRELALISPDGYKFFLAFSPAPTGGSELDLSSFSPCLAVPADFTLFDEY